MRINRHKHRKDTRLSEERRAPLWKWVLAFTVPILMITAFMTSLTIATYNNHASNIHDREELMNLKNTGVVLLDSEGDEFHRVYDANTTNGELVELADIPDHVVEALIATEDRNFYDHHGISIRGTAAAAYRNLTSNENLYGGSTLTQQLAKNTLLEDDRTIYRKYQELVISASIERTYTKDDILEMYLNSVYFGEGAFGIDSAARTYFSKPAEELTLAESSLLIGLLPAPSSWSPMNGDSEAALERQYIVLSSMEQAGYLQMEEKEEVLAGELELNPPQWKTGPFAKHYIEMVMNQLHSKYDDEEIIRSGFRVRTTLNSDWQELAESAVSERLDEIDERGASNGAAVIQDPKTGKLRALVGSRDWDDEEFGRVNAAMVPRQPGSSFKPIYYAKALEEGVITAATILEDEPTSFGSDDFEPENFDMEYRGDITVRDSLAQSRNITSVEVMERLGTENSVEFANQTGMSSINDSQYHGLALALGTAEVPLLDMTNAYGAFANTGVRQEMIMIEAIYDKYGEEVFAAEEEGERVLSEDASFIMSSMLSDEEARSPMFADELTFDGRAAVKTGSTDDNRDALTIGYTPSVAIGVWVGNNDNTPMTEVTGSVGAAPIWKNIMNSLLAELPDEEFSRPESVLSVAVCEEEGLPVTESHPSLTVYSEYFIKGTVPDGECEPEKPKEPQQTQESNREDRSRQVAVQGTSEPSNNDEPGRGGGNGEGRDNDNDEDDDEGGEEDEGDESDEEEDAKEDEDEDDSTEDDDGGDEGDSEG